MFHPQHLHAETDQVLTVGKQLYHKLLYTSVCSVHPYFCHPKTKHKLHEVK